MLLNMHCIYTHVRTLDASPKDYSNLDDQRRQGYLKYFTTYYGLMSNFHLASNENLDRADL